MLEAEKLGSSDAEQLAYATSQGATSMTHDRVDSEALARHCFETRQKHAGIIISSRRPPHEFVRRLLLILDQVTADETADQLRYI